MTVVAAYVPDATGYAVIGEAIKAARDCGSTLLVINCVGPAGFAKASAADSTDLEAVARRAQAAGVDAQVKQVHVGPHEAGLAIVSWAHSEDASLIVVGIVRRTVLGVLGSTVQKVVLGAQCPVMVVGAEAHETWP